MSRGSIDVSDPWDVASIMGGQPLTGVLEIHTAVSATLRLDRPVIVNGVAMKSAEVAARHVGTKIAEHCHAVPANIVFWSDDQELSCSAIGTVSVD
jgi:hypothetical protein